MLLSNGLYAVTVTVADKYPIGTESTDYDFVYYNQSRLEDEKLVRVFSIESVSSSCVIKIALVGDVLCLEDHSAVLNGNFLTVLQNKEIVRLDVSNGELMLRKKLDTAFCNFGVYEVENGFVIYGEEEILMLDFDFNELWSFLGEDIFVSQKRGNCFEISDGTIRFYDFNETYYELSLEGKVIKEIPGS